MSAIPGLESNLAGSMRVTLSIVFLADFTAAQMPYYSVYSDKNGRMLAGSLADLSDIRTHGAMADFLNYYLSVITI